MAVNNTYFWADFVYGYSLAIPYTGAILKAASLNKIRGSDAVMSYPIGCVHTILGVLL